MNKKTAIIKKILTPISKAMMFVFTLCFGIVAVGATIANANENEVTSFLGGGGNNIVYIDGEDDAGVSDFYQSDYNSVKEVRGKGFYFSQKMTEEGAVLLRNENNALPLAAGAKVSLFGASSAKPVVSGYREGQDKADGAISFKQGLTDAGLIVNAELYDWYANSDYGRKSLYNSTSFGNVYSINEAPWSELPESKIAADYKTAIFVVSRVGGEATDVQLRDLGEVSRGFDGKNGNYLILSAREEDVLSNLKAQKANGVFDKIVVIMNTTNQVACDFEDKYDVDALIYMGSTGSAGTKAVGEILVGKVNPSGKLADTFWKNHYLNPVLANWGAYSYNHDSANHYSAYPFNGASDYGSVVYREGIYSGYRYTETRYEDTVLGVPSAGDFVYSDAVAYPFGYGLSYSDFEYSDMQMSFDAENDSFEISVVVKNVRGMDGKNAVQLFLQKPYTDYDMERGIEKPAVELAGFVKTDLIAPQTTERYEITVDRKNFAVYDANDAKTYIVTEGEYLIAAGQNAHDAVNNVLAYRGKTEADGMDEAGDASMAACILDNSAVDDEIFSKSSARAHDTPNTLSETAVGTEIVNRLDFMDPNRFAGVTNTEEDDGDVVYVSRRDWLGTLPSEKTTLALTNKVEEKYDITSHKTIVEEENATMPKFGDASSDLTLAMMAGLKYDDDEWNKLLDKISQSDMFITLTNCYGFTPALASVAKPMTDEDDGPYGVSNTEEGYSSMSSEGVIASSFSVRTYRLVGEAIAADARSGHDATQKNLHGLYAPGLNIHRVTFGGRAAEYFSEDPYLSGIAALEEIQEMQAQYVVACPKHFIFNDEESNRNGISIWMSEQAAREIYLLPWEYACRADMGNAHSLMTSFNRAGGLWTSASDDLMEHILRGEWAFDGYTLTDMAGSNGKLFMVYDDGFMNGTDCFLDKGTMSGFSADMQRSNTFNTKLRQAMHRLLYTVANYSAAMDGYSNLTRLQPVVVWWKALIVFFTVLFAALCAASIAMFALSEVRAKKEKQ